MLDEVTMKYNSKSNNNEMLLLNIYLMDDDNYCIRLNNIDDDIFDNGIFSTWIDSCGGEVAGNQEVYKEGYEKDINYCYEVFGKLMED